MPACLIAVLMAAAMPGAGNATQPEAPEVVTGKVFLDANGNGTLDPGEKGLAGVRVTDGVQFVTTGPDGAYTLRVAPDPTFRYRQARTVGVCWPDNHWPTGSWWVRLSNVKDAAAVHFGLREETQKTPFTYLHMTDPHEFFNSGNADFLGWMNAMPADVKFMFDTGDSFRPKEVEKPYRIPFITAVGNHDTWESDKPNPIADEDGYGPFTKRLGPARWSFDFAGIHFVGVDVIEERKVKAMVDWLEKDLSHVRPGARVVMAYHYPDPGGDARFEKLLRDYKVELIMGGHNHTYGFHHGPPVPLITAYHWQPPGTCNVMAVSDKRIDCGVYCIGCQWKTKVIGGHSRRCPIVDRTALSAVGGLLAGKHDVPAGPLLATRTVAVAEPGVLVTARLTPGQARRVVLRVGAGAAPLEIAFTGQRLIVDGADFPFVPLPAKATLDMTVLAHGGQMTVWANNFFFLQKPVTLPPITAVSVFAEGGPGVVEAMTVQEIKAGPPANKTPTPAAK